MVRACLKDFLLMFPGKILTLNILAVLSYCLKNVLSRIFVFGMIKVAFDWIGPSILMKPISMYSIVLDVDP